MNIFKECLKDNIRRQVNLLMEEVLHLYYFMNFLSPPDLSDSSASPDRSCHPVFSLEKLRDFSKRLAEDIVSTARRVSDERFLKTYSEFVNIQNKLNLEIIPKVSFLQKKSLSFQSGHQHYFPYPKLTSFREAFKIHLYMENITREFWKSIAEGTYEKRVLFFWDYDTQVRFIDNRNDILKFVSEEKKGNLYLIINTDFFLPHRQSHWIILFHEVFHFLFNLYERANGDKVLLKRLGLSELIPLFEIIVEGINDCRLALVHSNISWFNFDPVVVVDSFIDAFLTKIFGVPFLLPISTRLFAFDEKSFQFPQRRRWFVRIKTLSSLNHIGLLEKLEPKLKSAFLDSFRQTVEDYEKKQISASASLVREDHFIIENIISKVIASMVDQTRMNFKFINNLLAEKEWLSKYVNYANQYTEHYLSAIINENRRNRKIEGRALCGIYQYYCSGHKTEKNEEKKLFDTPVIKFSLYKLRTNNFQYSKLDDKFQLSIGLSPYNLAFLDKEEIFEKEDLTSKQVLDKIERILNRQSCNNCNCETCYDLECSLLSRKLYFYKEELNLTFLSGFTTTNGNQSGEDESRKIEATKEMVLEHCNLRGKVGIFIKSQLKTRTNQNERDLFSEISENLREFSRKALKELNGIKRITCILFSSFDWFDYLILLLVEPQHQPPLRLKDILSFLKKNFILNNELLSRTETLIFIDNNIKDCITLPPIDVLLRVRSEQLGESWNFIERIVEKLPPSVSVISSFGVRDLTLRCCVNEEMSLSELLDFLDEYVLNPTLEVGISDVQIEPFIFWS